MHVSDAQSCLYSRLNPSAQAQRSTSGMQLINKIQKYKNGKHFISTNNASATPTKKKGNNIVNRILLYTVRTKNDKNKINMLYIYI